MASNGYPVTPGISGFCVSEDRITGEDIENDEEIASGLLSVRRINQLNDT